ncbi:MAG TPA: hypothetical protein VF228_09420 [Iamia sp.]
MAAPTAVVAARFAWVGYKDRLPFVKGRDRDEPAVPDEEPELVDTGVP